MIYNGKPIIQIKRVIKAQCQGFEEPHPELAFFDPAPIVWASMYTTNELTITIKNAMKDAYIPKKNEMKKEKKRPMRR